MKPQRPMPAVRVGRVERALLRAGMGVVAFFIERRVLKAIKRGSVKDKAPAGPGEAAALSAAPDEVDDKADR